MIQAERDGEANISAAMNEAAERLAEVQQEWQALMENAHANWGTERESLVNEMAQKEKDLRAETSQQLQVRYPLC